MAFTQDTFSVVGAASTEAPTVYSYSTTDSIATVLGAAYFQQKVFQLEEGDFVLSACSDGNMAGVVNSDMKSLTRVFEGGSSGCDLENFAILASGAPNQTEALSGDNNRVLTVTSAGLTNSQTTYGATNTSFTANQNQIIWLGDLEISSQNIPFTPGTGGGEVDNSNVFATMLLFDSVGLVPIAGFAVAWSMPHAGGVEVDALYDFVNSSTATFIVDGLALNNGDVFGFYYDVDMGKVYVATSTNTYELTIANPIVQANPFSLIVNSTAGLVSATSIGTALTQTGTPSLSAFPSAVPWCEADFV